MGLKEKYMSYATGHNSFTSQYLLNIYIILQIMYNKLWKYNFYKHGSYLLMLFYCPVLWANFLCHWRLCAWIMYYVELPWGQCDNTDQPAWG
jgi:hypothetical protein